MLFDQIHSYIVLTISFHTSTSQKWRPKGAVSTYTVYQTMQHSFIICVLKHTHTEIYTHTDIHIKGVPETVVDIVSKANKKGR
jgi:hypothetical protein